MTATAAQRPAIPDPALAERSIASWADGQPALKQLLAAMAPAQAATRFGLHLLKEGLNADAAIVFRAAIALSPGEADLWTNLAVALDRAGQAAEAAGALEESLIITPLQPDLWVFLGVVRGKLDDPGGAEEAYRTALAQDPKSSTAWQCLGLLKEAQRAFPEAIEALQKSIELGQTGAASWANLGKLCYQLGRMREAHQAYDAAARAEPAHPHYQRMLRQARFLREAIDGAPIEDGLAAYQASAAREPNGQDPSAWLELAAGLLSGLGHREAAIRVSKKRLELDPISASARYLYDALSGEALQKAPEDYIVESFDAFAEGFDAQLVGVLGYDVPQQLATILQKAHRPDASHLFDALDAGCGTGLCGPLLRPLCRKLVGADLSPKMLEQAALRGVYDQLLRGELSALLREHPGEFDLICAADVLLYFGDLGPLFAAAALALRPGGLFALNTELLAAPMEGERYHLMASGRFAHDPDYVRGVARAAFEEELFVDTTLRLDAMGRTRGNLFLFKRRAA